MVAEAAYTQRRMKTMAATDQMENISRERLACYFRSSFSLR